MPHQTAAFEMNCKLSSARRTLQVLHLTNNVVKYTLDPNIQCLRSARNAIEEYNGWDPYTAARLYCKRFVSLVVPKLPLPTLL